MCAHSRDNMADFYSNDGFVEATCPYEESDEHSSYEAVRAGVRTGVCEYHICRGVGTCRNPMLPPDGDAGAPFCARKECQALRGSAEAMRRLPPELWYKIASHMRPEDVGYLRDAVDEHNQGVELFVRDQRARRDMFTEPDYRQVISARSATSSNRYAEYLRALSVEELGIELVRTVRAGDYGGARLVMEAGAVYTDKLGELIAVSVCNFKLTTSMGVVVMPAVDDEDDEMRVYHGGETFPVLDMLRHEMRVLDWKGEIELMRRLLMVEWNREVGSLTDIDGFAWLLREYSYNGGPDDRARMQHFLLMAASAHRQDAFMAVFRSWRRGYAYPRQICSVLLRRAANPPAEWVTTAMRRMHSQNNEHGVAPPCAPDYCSWARANALAQ